MAQPLYFSQGGINVASEFQQWLTANWQDATDTISKLTALGLHGMGQINLFSNDTHAPPDFFCRQVNGWACFYVAKAISNTEAQVAALYCTAVLPTTGLAAANEAQRRRTLAGV